VVDWSTQGLVIRKIKIKKQKHEFFQFFQFYQVKISKVLFFRKIISKKVQQELDNRYEYQQ
jgi:hypothetical protein